ncbi:MAG: hypothetical protein WCK02_14975 [Bacteroidota bacterium]
MVVAGPYLLSKEKEVNIKDPINKPINIYTKPIKASISPKTVFTNEWLVFKSKSEKEISKNENHLQKIKENPRTVSNTSLNRKIANLQSSNNDLRLEIIKYNNDEKLKRDNFKTKINNDIDKIAIEVKVLVLNNK